MIKAAELKGDQLDYWVARAESLTDPRIDPPFGCVISTSSGSIRYSPSTDWSEGGPIIERELLVAEPGINGIIWNTHKLYPAPGMAYSYAGYTGESLLESAMRCYVASKFGDIFDGNTLTAPSPQAAVPESQEARLPATIEINSEDKDAWV